MSIVLSKKLGSRRARRETWTRNRSYWWGLLLRSLELYGPNHTVTRYIHSEYVRVTALNPYVINVYRRAPIFLMLALDTRRLDDVYWSQQLTDEGNANEHQDRLRPAARADP